MKKANQLQKGDIIEIDRDRLVVFDTSTFGSVTTIQFANSGEIANLPNDELLEVFGETDIFTYPLQKPEFKHINYEHRRLALQCASNLNQLNTEAVINDAQIFERWLNGENVNFDEE